MSLKPLAFLACGILATGLAAQQVPVAPTAPITPANYLLGTGDRVTVRVLDLEEIPDHPFEVDTAGNINLPVAGGIPAAGLTTSQVQAGITQKLSAYLKKPSVTVSLTEARELPITVAGAVYSPGVKLIRGHKTLLEAIAEAGGLRPEAGSVVKLTRVLAEGPIPLPGSAPDATGQFYVAEVRLASLIRSENPRENVSVHPHDIVAVPQAGVVYVLGEVTHPGGYEITAGDTLSVLNAVAKAGGTERDAFSSRARVLRKVPGKTERTEMIVDLNRMLAGKQKEFELLPEDILYVPTNRGKAVTARVLETVIGTGAQITVYRSSRY